MTFRFHTLTTSLDNFIIDTAAKKSKKKAPRERCFFVGLFAANVLHGVAGHLTARAEIKVGAAD